MQSKKILVTGGTGQVGKTLAGMPRPGELNLLLPDRGQLDLRSEESIHSYLNNVEVDYIINCAAYTNVDKAETEEDEAFAVNSEAPGIIARHAVEKDIPMIQLSTDYVFDGLKKTAYIESDTPNPINIYGKSKLRGEQAVLDSGAKAIVLRTAWVFSEYGRNFLKTMLRIGTQDQSIKVVDDQFGTPTSAETIAKTIGHIISQPNNEQKVPTGIFHCTNAGATNWHGYASYIFESARRFGYKTPNLIAVPSASYPTASGRPANSQLHTGKLEQAFKQQLEPWQKEVDKTVGKLLENVS